MFGVIQFLLRECDGGRMKIHELKTDPEYYKAVNYDRKKAELRCNDRDFNVGDILVLRPFDREENKYMPDVWGDSRYVDNIDEACYLLLRVTHVLISEDFPQGLQHGYVMLSFEKIEK